MRTIRVNLSIAQPDFSRLEKVYESVYERSEIPQNMSLTGFCTMLLMSMLEDIENGDAVIRPVRSVIRPGRPKVSE